MKVAALPRSMAQVAAVLAFVISHTTFLTAQDDEMGRCPKVVFSHQSPVTSHQHLVHHEPCFRRKTKHDVHALDGSTGGALAEVIK